MNTVTGNVITEGTLTLVGKNHDGRDVEVEAEVYGLCIEVNNETHTPYSPYSTGANIYSPNHDVEFTFKVKKGYTVKVKDKVKSTVVRTARVEALFIPENTKRRELTLTEVIAAAAKAGVDENTEFGYIYEKDVLRGGTIIYVEFRWTE